MYRGVQRSETGGERVPRGCVTKPARPCWLEKEESVRSQPGRPSSTIRTAGTKARRRQGPAPSGARRGDPAPCAASGAAGAGLQPLPSPHAASALCGGLSPPPS